MIVKYYQRYDFRDETSFTSVGGPNYWNEYLQYGVSHCDDFFYIFKVTNSIYDQRFFSLRSIENIPISPTHNLVTFTFLDLG